MARLKFIVGVLCWLLVSLTSTQANAVTMLSLGDSVMAVTEKVGSCHKLSVPMPIDRQCSGTPAQSAATARSRHDDKDKAALISLPAGLAILLHAYTDRPTALPAVWTATHQRRSSFWHVYAFSMRMRN